MKPNTISNKEIIQLYIIIVEYTKEVINMLKKFIGMIIAKRNASYIKKLEKKKGAIVTYINVK